jgi:integrase/recombinase XerD
MSDVKFILKHEKRADGKNAIYMISPFFVKEGYIKINLKFCADFQNSIAVFEKDFDTVNEKVLKSEPNYKSINFIISKARSRADEIIMKYQVLNKKLTKTLFRNEFIYGKSSSDESFFDYIEKKIKERRYDSKANKKLADQSLTQHFAFLSVLRKFKKKLLFSDLTEDLVFEFKTYLKNTNNKYGSKYENSSINNLIRKLRQYVMQAIKDGFVFENPFRNLSLNEKEEINIIALNTEEIKILIDLYNSGKLTLSQRDILKQYLFSCFTGLRLSDIKSLKNSDIKENILKLTAKKNRKNIEIPLSKFAVFLLNDNFYKNKNVSNVFVNHGHNKYYNQPLKKMLQKFTDIRKDITFHTARKTFATNYLNQNPEDYVTLADYLGDTLQQTLKTYAKIVTKTKADRISFLDNFIPEVI